MLIAVFVFYCCRLRLQLFLPVLNDTTPVESLPFFIYSGIGIRGRETLLCVVERPADSSKHSSFLQRDENRRRLE
jgi:hypothetical protein